MEKIKKLELELLQPEVRKNKKRLNELLTDGFIEITSIGTVINKKDVLKNLPKEENGVKWKVSNFKTNIIQEGVILITYKVQKINLKNKKNITSLRSSLWKYINNNWQMVFHQGTLIDK